MHLLVALGKGVGVPAEHRFSNLLMSIMPRFTD